jgi:hypothetical protein
MLISLSNLTNPFLHQVHSIFINIRMNIIHQKSNTVNTGFV